MKELLPTPAISTSRNPSRINLAQSRIFTVAFTAICCALAIFMLNPDILSCCPLWSHSFGSTSTQLPQAIQVDNVIEHLKNLEAIALAHPSHSRSVENAYNQSAEYVINQLKTQTDCDMSFQYFKVPVWSEDKPPIMSLDSPHTIRFQPGVDFRVMRYGGQPAKLTKTKLFHVENGGCSDGDFTKIPKGSVALISADLSLKQCSLWDSAYKAQQGGASAVIFYNEFERTGLMGGRVRIVNWKEGDPLMTVPVISVIQSVGSLLLAETSVKLSLESFSNISIADTFNIICETKEGNPDSVVMIGAHLDSVPAGPGMVDNASGSSSVLEVFLKMYSLGLNKEMRNKIRFGWWGAEELGLLGSRHYCRELAKNTAEFEKVVLYANHDMLASPNYVPFIYRGGSAPENLRKASTHLQELYENYFKSLPPLSKFADNYEFSEMTGGSDFYSFLEIGIPSGGLATGAGGIKTMEQRHKFGGFANAPLDPCYHQSCDTVENIGKDVLEVMAKSVGFIVEYLGRKENIREWLQQ